MSERINRFSGKPMPDYASWGRSALRNCDECGTGVICDCPVCGAPNCCPRCCDEDAQALSDPAPANEGEAGR